MYLSSMHVLSVDRLQLFNASAVIESRASTRLGENVKLLTFVSIFFLPLAFTTVSLPWSICAFQSLATAWKFGPMSPH